MLTLDRDRRSLQYAIYSKDQDEASSQIQEIDIELKKLASSTTSNLDTEAQNLAQEISKIESKITDLKFEHQELLNDRNDVVRSSASLELEIADYGDGDGDFERYKTDLDRIVNGISRKQRDLQVLEDSLVGVLEKEAELKATVDSYKNEQACLYSKQNRLSKFKNKKERDNWLASEIKQVQLNSKSQKQQVDEIDSEISDLQVQINTATNEIETIESKLTAGKQVLSKFESQDKTYRQEKYKLEEERKSLWKTDAQTVKSTMELKEKLANLKRVFDSTLDRVYIYNIEYFVGFIFCLQDCCKTESD